MRTVRLAFLALLACEPAPPPPDGDSAALAAVPPRLAEELAVERVLTAEAVRDTARVKCETLGERTAPELRRRLRATLPDSARTVLFVRADRATGEPRRVEVVRRDGPAQRGLIWDAETGATRQIEWRDGVGRAPEITTLPRGGPAAGALRALGRRLLALSC